MLHTTNSLALIPLLGFLALHVNGVITSHVVIKSIDRWTFFHTVGPSIDGFSPNVYEMTFAVHDGEKFQLTDWKYVQDPNEDLLSGGGVTSGDLPIGEGTFFPGVDHSLSGTPIVSNISHGRMSATLDIRLIVFSAI
jgi:hypothetical protein